MKIVLLVIGKTQNCNIRLCIDDYLKRLSHYISFDIQVIPDLKNTKSITNEMQKNQEADLILNTIDTSDYVVLLDEHGKDFTSIQFSNYIEKKMTNIPRRLMFIIGGPYGFSQKVYDRAQEKISLSKMTFNHEMVRLIFTEQLYRAMSIINNEPYHHE